jgi:WD40 repeat protein
VSVDSRRLIALAASDLAATSQPVLWDLEHDRRIKSLESPQAEVSSAHFVRGDQEILTVGYDGTVRLWDGSTGEPLPKKYPGSTRYLVDAALSPDGTMLVTAGGDGWLRFWDADS